jgi:hypothetical protein
MKIYHHNIFFIVISISIVLSFILNFFVIFVNKINILEKKQATKYDIRNIEFFKKSYEQKNFIINYWLFILFLLCIIVYFIIINDVKIIKYITRFKHEIILYLALVLLFFVSFYFYNVYYLGTLIDTGTFNFDINIT